MSQDVILGLYILGFASIGFLIVLAYSAGVIRTAWLFLKLIKRTLHGKGHGEDSWNQFQDDLNDLR